MKRGQSGTFSSIAGLQRTTRWTSKFAQRLVGFAVAVALVTLLIVRIDTSIWREHARLQEGFAAIKAEKFYFGVNFRVSLRKLNATLLDYQHTANPADLEAFRTDSRQLKSWLRTKKNSFVSSAEREAFSRLEAAYAEFVARVSPLLSTNASWPPGGGGFEQAYARIRQDSRDVLKACDDVVQAEHSEFDQFVQGSENALLSLQRLFLFSLLLLVALAATVAILIYRGMLAPLRAKLSESELIIERQEKLAALGVLGAGLAHEIRNPLTAIKFRLFSLKKSLPPDTANNEDTSIISDEINRLDRIVKEFLQFARPAEPELTPVPAERILKEVGELMNSELAQAAIDLKLDLRTSSWIRADIRQIKQVLINLIQNSADSIGRQGLITLRLTEAGQELHGKAQSTAILAVADTGKGIPPEVQKRLFDPFFTTKEGGTGLGLAIAARIIEKHGGLLRYKTETNQGTIFEIVLPKIQGDAGKNLAD